MQRWLRDSALCFSAGAIGAVAKSAVIWLCAQVAFTTGLASLLASGLHPAGIYVRVVWGGIAAFLFLLPIAAKNWVARGLLWGAIVAALQVVAIPLLNHSGLHLALLPLLATLALSLLWGFATALALRLFGG